ncbi:EI24 domain-containing protein [Paracoccus onubensis]|uniref:EI24 domain-containing protein n=1 Tax=Paracoccus onubensis TaxID=1675788 RepID=UPI002731E991|nr:EI24 domain-containing protein [Paracoccus onubensis]MDP0928411.1 EI24 domain-containing protein [Paracoccus onubensis]
MIVTRALFRAWGDLLRPQILSLVLMGIALTILLFILLQAGTFWLIRLFTPGSFSLPWIGVVDVGSALSWSSLALFPLMGFFLMAPVAAGFCGIFAERVSEAVEQIHYPSETGQSLDFMDGLLESLALMAAVIGVAILSLLLTPFLGPLAPILFYGANGWLLGREFFQMAARRHLRAAQATSLRKSNGVTITIAGAMIAVLLTVPLLNIAAPLLASAAFTHLFHLIRGKAGRNSPVPRG